MLEFNVRGGKIILKLGTPKTIQNWVSFLISHHRYDLEKFKTAKGTVIWDSIERIEEDNK